MKNIIVAVDFSTATEPAVNLAADLAKALGSKLWVLHITSDETQAMAFEYTQFTGYAPELTAMPGDVHLARDISAEEIRREHKELLSISSKLRTDGVDAQALLIKGETAKLIVDKAKELEAEMIILGSHGHGILHKAILGSISEAVLNRATCSVLVVPMVGK